VIDSLLTGELNQLPRGGWRKGVPGKSRYSNKLIKFAQTPGGSACNAASKPGWRGVTM